MSYKVSNKVFLFIQGILLAILTFKSLANCMLDKQSRQKQSEGHSFKK